MKRCVQCRQPFTPRASTLQVACSPACSLAWVKARPERAEAHRKRMAARERREVRETPSRAMAAARTAFHAWIRQRDAGKPCISCGHPDDGTRKRNAGHYQPAGSNPALRFDESNVHGQCETCNSYLSGNLIAYRIELICRIGITAVRRLEGPHELPHRTAADFREIEAEYRARLNTARKGAA